MYITETVSDRFSDFKLRLCDCDVDESFNKIWVKPSGIQCVKV